MARECIERPYGVRAIDDSVVERQVESDVPAEGDPPTVVGDRPVTEARNTKDSDLRRIDDRVEGFDAEHPEVRDRARPAGEVAPIELAVDDSLGQHASFPHEFGQRLRLDRPEYWRHQSPLYVDRDPHVLRVVSVDGVVPEQGIERRVFGEGSRDSQQEKVGHRNVDVEVLVGDLGRAEQFLGIDQSVDRHMDSFTVALTEAIGDSASRRVASTDLDRRGEIWCPTSSASMYIP